MSYCRTGFLQTNTCEQTFKDRINSTLTRRNFEDNALVGGCNERTDCGYPMAPIGHSGMGNPLCDPAHDMNMLTPQVTRWKGRVANPHRVFIAPPSFDSVNTNGGREQYPAMSREKKTTNNFQGTCEAYALPYYLNAPATVGVLNTVRNPMNYLYNYNTSFQRDENPREEYSGTL
jgi:hypothetical protein